METLKIEVQIRSKYGRDLIYPVNRVAFKFTELLNKKTFNRSDLEKLTEIGFNVEFVLRSLDLSILS